MERKGTGGAAVEEARTHYGMDDVEAHRVMVSAGMSLEGDLPASAAVCGMDRDAFREHLLEHWRAALPLAAETFDRNVDLESGAAWKLIQGIQANMLGDLSAYYDADNVCGELTRSRLAYASDLLFRSLARAGARVGSQRALDGLADEYLETAARFVAMDRVVRFDREAPADWRVLGRSYVNAWVAAACVLLDSLHAEWMDGEEARDGGLSR